MTSRFDGKVAVVTGAASGIGRRTAELLASGGARVVLGDRDGGRVAEVADSLGGGGAAALEVDVTDEAAVEALVGSAVERFGRLDIGVNCAGVGTLAPIHQHPLDAWRAVIDTSLTGVFLSTKHELRQMLAQGSPGSVVNVASINGRQPAEGMSAYCSAKAGVEALTKVAALEAGPHQVRVNAVAPGFVETPMTAPVPPTIRQAYVDSVPLGRPGQPDDIARAIAFLASDESSWVNGEVLVVDGGEVHRGYPRMLTGRDG